jgi:hypothetical protein
VENNSNIPRAQLALSVDPTSKGFAFVVLENGLLVDWGVRRVRSNKNHDSVMKLRLLIQRYKPDIVVLEDVHHRSSRRGSRARRLLGRFAREAHAHGVAVTRVSQEEVQRRLGAHPGRQLTKHRIALVLADKFPELWEHLPRVRKIWMAEDERMNIFDALAMAIVAMDIWNTPPAAETQVA